MTVSSVPQHSAVVIVLPPFDVYKSVTLQPPEVVDVRIIQIAQWNVSIECSKQNEIMDWETR